MLKLPTEKLKEMVVAEGLISAENFDSVAIEANRISQPVEDMLIAQGALSLDFYYQLLGKYFGISTINLSNTQIDPEVLNLLSVDLAKQKKAIIFNKEENGVLDVAMEDPSDLKTIEFLERYLKARIKPFLVKSKDLEKGYAIYNKQLSEDFKKIIEENIQNSFQLKNEKAEDIVNAMPVVAVVDNFLSYAFSLGASDIHIEALEAAVLVRFRVDGILHEITRIPNEVQRPILARIKLLAGLKIDEHFKPQDGRFRHKTPEGSLVDVRVSIMPVLYGEKVVMRLLPATQKPVSLDELGMLPDMIEMVKENLGKSYGMILVTGPTGSGKTTTLYSILNMLNRPEVNIVTVEDPIEYNLQYINQTQINPVAGVTFASALRAFLRQDPNIILVGEIRDEETAEISVHAALTGHLVLSSLHTNDAPTTIPRFIDMNVPPFLVAAVLNVIIAQRLVRKICSNCIESFTPEQGIVDAISKERAAAGIVNNAEMPKLLFRGKGCPVCSGTGYKGRIGIYEILNVDSEIRSLINNNFNLDDLIKLMKNKGMVTMFEDGIRKAALGMTTVEEVLRVIRE